MTSSIDGRGDDHGQLQALLGRYGIAADWGSAEDAAALFHADGTLLPHFQGPDVRCVGRAAIAAWFESYFAKTRAPRRYVRHKLFTPAIVVDGDTARSSVYFDAESVTKDSDIVSTGTGRYDSTFVKQDGRWWIKEHSIVVYYVRRTLGLTPLGEVPAPAVLGGAGK